MKKITLIIFILAILLFGGKFGLERYYESKLDKLIGLVKFSVGDINHKGVTIGFDGSISINRLSIRPHAIDTTVSIEKISLFSSDRLLPLKIANSFEKKEIPENIGLRVNDLEYNPNLYMPKIDSKNECRYIETPINYSSLGIRKLNSDLEMSINTSNKSDSLIEMTSVDQTSSSKRPSKL